MTWFLFDINRKTIASHPDRMRQVVVEAPTTAAAVAALARHAERHGFAYKYSIAYIHISSFRPASRFQRDFAYPNERFNNVFYPTPAAPQP